MSRARYASSQSAAAANASKIIDHPFDKCDASRESCNRRPIRAPGDRTPGIERRPWRWRGFATHCSPRCMSGTRRSRGQDPAAHPLVPPTVLIESDPKALSRRWLLLFSRHVTRGAGRTGGAAAASIGTFPGAIRMSFADPADVFASGALHGLEALLSLSKFPRRTARTGK